MTSDGFLLVDELATSLNPEQWILVGGLMVHAHAQLAGLDGNRPTSDADVVVNLALQTSTGDYRRAALAIQSLGFQPHDPPAGTVFRIPTLPGALALKGAACNTSSSPVIRHNQDAVVLFACADVRTMRPLSKSQRAHVNRLFTGFSKVEAWQLAAPEVRLRALRAIRDVRPDWVAPEFLRQGRPRRGR